MKGDAGSNSRHVVRDVRIPRIELGADVRVISPFEFSTIPAHDLVFSTEQKGHSAVERQCCSSSESQDYIPVGFEERRKRFLLFRQGVMPLKTDSAGGGM